MALKNPAFWLVDKPVRKGLYSDVVRIFPYLDRLLAKCFLFWILRCFDMEKALKFFENTLW